jgi:molybdopterin converting factor small subunit
MSMIKVKYRGALSAQTGVTEETLESADVESLLRTVGKQHGREAEKAARTMLIALNGESILLLKRYKPALNEGDAVNFFPLCAGG